MLACVTRAATTGARPELVAWLVLAPVAVLLAVVDRRVHRLPDPLTLPLAAAAILLLGGAAALPGFAGLLDLRTAEAASPSAASTSCSS
ncbi:hypothetical protein SBADM41S_06249 [Streptomyces badius]